MTPQEKQLARLAVLIHEQIVKEHSSRANNQLPQASWRQSERLLRRICQAERRGWQLAAERLRQELRTGLLQIQSELTGLDRSLTPSAYELSQTSINDLYADLVTLYREFDDVRFHRREHMLSVVTEPLELEGVYLGTFEIRLDWGKLTEGHPHNYRVFALDANPAATNDCVTHPHVQDEVVCEGAGHLPIRKALEQGRLLDFFELVASLLRTYNSASPFVSLPNWYGVECADCGDTICDDERYSCEKCETIVCGECYFSCSDCDGIFCVECVTSCEECCEKRCNSCSKQCSHCGKEFCQDCLDDQERCSDCHDQQTEEQGLEPADSEESGGNHVTSLQPNRLGETALST